MFSKLELIGRSIMAAFIQVCCLRRRKVCQLFIIKDLEDVQLYDGDHLVYCAFRARLFRMELQISIKKILGLRDFHREKKLCTRQVGPVTRNMFYIALHCV